MHPLLHALIRLAIIYAIVWAVCFAMEGAFRYKHGRLDHRDREAVSDARSAREALVARQHRIDEMNNDLPYGLYVMAVLFGTPIAMFFVIRHPACEQADAPRLEAVPMVA